MTRRPFALFGGALLLIAVTLTSCSSGHDSRSVTGLLASLPKTASDQPAEPFVVTHVPPGHVVTDMFRGSFATAGTSTWCAAKVCASSAFSGWRSLGWDGLSTRRDPQRWPSDAYVVIFDAPAPRVDDGRRFVLPTGAAIDVSMVPGSRADLALGAGYDAMGSYEGEHGPAHDVWFDRRTVKVGSQIDLLTESYGTTEAFPRDVKTLYFAGPHGELGIVRSTTNVFYPTANTQPGAGSPAALRHASHRAAARQQTNDAELVAVAVSVRSVSAAGFARAANRVSENRICTPDEPADSGTGRVILSAKLPNGQTWVLRQGRDPQGRVLCPFGGSPSSLGRWSPRWGDWQRSKTHSVYAVLSASNESLLVALAPDVRTVTIHDDAGRSATVQSAPGLNGVRWALSPISARKVTAFDASGRVLETVRVDLAGP